MSAAANSNGSANEAKASDEQASSSLDAHYRSEVGRALRALSGPRLHKGVVADNNNPVNNQPWTGAFFAIFFVTLLLSFLNLQDPETSPLFQRYDTSRSSRTYNVGRPRFAAAVGKQGYGGCKDRKCEYFKIISSEMVGANEIGSLFDLEYEIWSATYALDVSSDTHQAPLQVSHSEKTSISLFCSLVNPVIFIKDKESWSSRSVRPGSPALNTTEAESDHNFYLAGCHNIVGKKVGFGQSAPEIRSLGYSKSGFETWSLPENFYASPSEVLHPFGQDSSFPALKGLNYRKRRNVFIALGYVPMQASSDFACSSDDSRCSGLPEVVECAGTGLANCKFEWKSKDGKILDVFTIGETQAIINSIAFNGGIPSDCSNCSSYDGTTKVTTSDFRVAASSSQLRSKAYPRSEKQDQAVGVGESKEADRLSFTTYVADDGERALSLNGVIAEGDASRLMERLRSDVYHEIAISSSGGDIAETVLLSRMIRSEHIRTVVKRFAECTNMCLILLNSGSTKTVMSPGYVGVQRGSIENLDSEKMTDLIADAFRGTGVPDDIISIMRSTSIENLRELNAEELRLMNISLIKEDGTADIAVGSPLQNGPLPPSAALTSQPDKVRTLTPESQNAFQSPAGRDAASFEASPKNGEIAARAASDSPTAAQAQAKGWGSVEEMIKWKQYGFNTKADLAAAIRHRFDTNMAALNNQADQNLDVYAGLSADDKEFIQQPISSAKQERCGYAIVQRFHRFYNEKYEENVQSEDRPVIRLVADRSPQPYMYHNHDYSDAVFLIRKYKGSPERYQGMESYSVTCVYSNNGNVIGLEDFKKN